MAPARATQATPRITPTLIPALAPGLKPEELPGVADEVAGITAPPTCVGGWVDSVADVEALVDGSLEEENAYGDKSRGAGAWKVSFVGLLQATSWFNSPQQLQSPVVAL